MQGKKINNFSSYWFVFDKKKIFFSSDLILGHDLKRSTFEGNRALFHGVRNNRLIYNYDYLFLNFIKKIALLKNLSNANSEFIFLTARKEFAFIIKKYAAFCGCKALVYSNVNDIGKIFETKKKSEAISPVFILFNNDKGASYNSVQELMKKKGLAFSVMDTDSLGIDYFFCLYGNDDSTAALSFYAKLLAEVIKNRKSVPVINNKLGDGRSHSTRINDNLLFLNNLFTLKNNRNTL